MENKQTAVEFIESKLEMLGILDKGEVMTKIFQQAKEMEHEQIIDSFNFGTINWDKDITAEQFYNQTYGRASN